MVRPRCRAEARAIRRYADAQSEATRATIVYYGQLAALYARHERGEISRDALLRARAGIFARAEGPLQWDGGPLNNVGIATLTTYSRHHPFLERVFNALARTVAFFKHVDKVKPAKAKVLKRQRIAQEDSLDLIRAYGAAVPDTVRGELASVGKQVEMN